LSRVSELKYFGFCDPSGGSSDSMTLGIAHVIVRSVNGGKAQNFVILDALREIRPPFSPDRVVWEFSELLRAYGVSEVSGDRYAGAWVVELFSKNRISYRASEKSRSEIYLDFLPLLNAGRAELIDERRLVAQLCSLERKSSANGRDSVDHPRGSHDDLANAAAGALVLASASANYNGVAFMSVRGKSKVF
jgi:hypothetical protein